MKTLHSALIAVVVAVGVTPSALAETTDVQSAPQASSAFTRAGLTPVAHEAPLYPVRAEADREEGACTVVFDIAASGAVTNPELKDCTSLAFRREALRVVGALEYPARPGGSLIEDQEITFRWAGQE